MSILSKIASFFSTAPQSTPSNFNGYNVLTYNYSGGQIPQMTAFGLPNSVAMPDLPTSIPNGYANDNADLPPNYYPGANKMSALGLTADQITLGIPTTVDDVSTQSGVNVQDTAPACSFCDSVVNGLLGGTLVPAPVQTTATNSSGVSTTIVSAS